MLDDNQIGELKTLLAMAIEGGQIAIQCGEEDCGDLTGISGPAAIGMSVVTLTDDADNQVDEIWLRITPETAIGLVS